MTESEWWESGEPQVLIEFLRDNGSLSERKARLFAATACRRVWHLLADEGARRVVHAFELYADGEASRMGVVEAWAEMLGPLLGNFVGSSAGVAPLAAAQMLMGQ